MSPYYDIYVLSNERTKSIVTSFLKTFAPIHEQSKLEYAFPEFSDSTNLILEQADEAIEYCLQHPNERQGIYLRNTECPPAQAMLFFTVDAALILGLSVSCKEEYWLERLMDFADSRIGLLRRNVRHLIPMQNFGRSFRIWSNVVSTQLPSFLNELAVRFGGRQSGRRLQMFLGQLQPRNANLVVQ